MVTCEEFVGRVSAMVEDKNFTGPHFYLKDWFTEGTPEEIREYNASPLTREAVLMFAEDMCAYLYERLSGIGTDALYARTYNEGHAFLREVHRITSECGLEIKLEEIDSAVTPTDALVERGLVGLGDRGEIIPKIRVEED